MNKKKKHYHPIAKRIFDLSVAVPLVVILFPVILLAWLSIRLSSRGSAFFIQERYGKEKKKFRFIKFRTMYQETEYSHENLHAMQLASEGILYKTAGDPRITPVGKILRKT